MDLMGGYLLVIIILFSANFSLLLGNIKFTNFKIVVISLIISISSFILFNMSNYINYNLLDYFSYFFIGLSILLFLIALYYVKFNNFKLAISLFVILTLTSTTLLSSQTGLSIFDDFLYSLFIFITTFLVYQISKMLIYAKREYPVIVSEYMSLSAILLFIFGLTYYSTLNLDYSMFSPFLILTPTYQLIYIIIFIIAILVIGVVYNDNIGGSL